MFMSVTLKLAKSKTIDEGYEWADSLPNSWFNKPCGFDGNDFGPLGRSAILIIVSLIGLKVLWS